MAGFARGALGGATSGISQLLGSLMMGDRAQQRGYDAESSAQSKLAQSLAMVQQAQAAARAHDAQAAEAGAKTEVLQRRPGIADEVMASSAGVDVPTLTAYRQRLRTGQAPQVPMGPPAEDGGMGLGAEQFDPGTSSRISQALVRLAPVLNSEKDLNPEQYAKGASVYRGMDLGDQVLAGQRTAADVGRSQAAIEGKPLVAGHEFGVVDNFSGAVDSSNPVAQRFGVYRTSETDKNNAQAGAANASAGHSRASTDKVNAEIAELNSGPGKGGKAPAGYRWMPDGKTLEAIPGGPADKAHSASEGERKAGSLLMRLRGSQQQLLGVVGETPSADKPIATAEFVRKIPLIGDASANGLTPEARQRVEAAQLDMLDAALTLGTGAAYTKEQLIGYRNSYFPAINDKPKTIADKRVRLANIIRAAEIAAGRSATDAVPVVPGSAGPQAGGASGGWGGTAPNGQRVVPVTY